MAGMIGFWDGYQLSLTICHRFPKLNDSRHQSVILPYKYHRQGDMYQKYKIICLYV